MPGLTPLSLGIEISLVGIGGVTNPDVTDDILLETGFFALLDDGGKIIQE